MKTAKVQVLQNRSPETRATFAIPDGDSGARRNSVEASYNLVDLVGVELPAKPITDRLVDIYFYTVHWFSLVVYEPKFRQRYENITTTGLARSADLPFLLLLLMILVMSCHYGRDLADVVLQDINLDELGDRYLKVVRSSFMDLMDEDCIEFIQICTLLGSYWLYWGKPRSSFTILGAAIKSAQAASLHRKAGGRYPSGNRPRVEEQKRVWWTIYTWDRYVREARRTRHLMPRRFATIVYGRPMGINDRDCDVPMPAIFDERMVDIHTAEVADIELSSYQMYLNRAYQIASPVLENIYSIRNPTGTSISAMAQTVKRIDEAMRQWRSTLPPELDLDQNPDLSVRPALREKLHQLQSLSLRLTYLNLTIIIHRPLLADRENNSSGAHSENDPHAISELKQVYDSSFEQCLEAALAISRLGQHKPNLLLLASKTHLLSFLAMNIFTSSVVLFICAMSDVLSNTAQEAKRGMSRNLKILKSIASRGSLSSQCSIIVGDLVQLILDKEKQEMLLGPLGVEDTNGSGESSNVASDHLIAVPLQSNHRSCELSKVNRTVPHENFEPAFGDSTVSFGKTMQQLHRGKGSERSKRSNADRI